MHICVVGGGVNGIGSALYLARRAANANGKAAAAARMGVDLVHYFYLLFKL